MTLPVLYICRPGENEELRYSLRSLRNFPHSDVFIVGNTPDWVKGVTFIEANRYKTKPRNVFGNLLTAATHPDTPDEFVILNDDFYVTAPAVEAPKWYRGTLKAHLAHLSNSWWKTSLINAQRWLEQVHINDPLSYELHVPFAVQKDKLAEVLGKAGKYTPHNPPQWRTIYGNYWRIGGTQREDIKQYRDLPRLNTPFHSTNDRTFRHSFHQLAQAFPTPSPHE